MGTAYEVIGSTRDRPDWLAKKRDGLGASEAAALAGLNPYDSPTSIFTEKSGLAPVHDGPPSEFARWGLLLEPLLFKRFAEETGREVRREGRLLRSKARPWQLCTLDAQQRDDDHRDSTPGLLEAKTTKFAWEDIVPEDVMAQVQHQFSVTGWEWGSIACWNRVSCDFFHVDVEPDTTYIAELNEIEEKFWRDLVQGIPPEVDDSEATTKALKFLYPKHIEGKVVNLEAHMLDVTDDLELVKVELSELIEKRRGLENLVKAAIADAEGGLLPNGVIYTHKLQHRKETIQKASSFRVLRRRQTRDGR